MNTYSQRAILGEEILGELEKTSFSNLKKRITNELIEFKKDNAYINVEDNEGNGFILTIVPDTEDTVYTFYITKDFPFNAPARVLVNHRNIKSYFRIQSTKTLNELKMYYNITCLCCHSIACNNNWTPVYKLSYFIDEFRKVKKYRRDIINRILVQKIIKKYLLKDINILEWLDIHLEILVSKLTCLV
jgi:hypothetical protein